MKIMIVRLNKYALLFLLLVSIIISSIPAVAYSDDEYENVRLGYFEYSNMMEGMSDDTVKSGFAYEYMSAIADLCGWKYQYVYGTYEELLGKLRDGEIDILPYVIYTNDRSYQMKFSAEPVGEDEYYLVSCGGQGEERNIYSVAGKRIGLFNEASVSSLMGSYLSSCGVGALPVVFGSESEMIAAASDGSIDFCICSAASSSAVPSTGFIASIGTLPFYAAFSNNRSDLLERFNRAQVNLHSVFPGFEGSLAKKYYNPVQLRMSPDSDEMQWIYTHDIIRAGYTSDMSPYIFSEKDGTVEGIIPEAFNYALSNISADVSVEWHEYSTDSELVFALSNGEIDTVCPFPYDYSFSEQSGFIISNPVISTNMAALFIGEFTDDTLRTIAVPNSFVPGYYVEKYYPEAELIQCDSLTDAVKAVLNGDAGCAVASSFSLNHTELDYLMLYDVTVETLNNQCPISFACRISDSALARLISRTFPLASDYQINDYFNEHISEVTRKISFVPSVVDSFSYLAYILAFLFLLLLFMFIFMTASGGNRRKRLRELSEARRQLEDVNEKTERKILRRTSELQKMNDLLAKSNDEVVELLSDVIDMRDRESGTHIRRVKTFTNILARCVMENYPEYGLTAHDVQIITSASALHDVGKIMIPDAILLKPGRLTDEEFSVMKSHTVKGCEILMRASVNWSSAYQDTSMKICRSHHERYDGSGYPDGLAGDDIPLSAQIVSLADVFDALTEERVYKKAFSPEVAYEMITTGKCGVFSPKLIDCFAKSFNEFKETISNPDFVRSGRFNNSSGGDMFKKLSILVVDDDDVSRSIICELLEDEGATVVSAVGGEDGVEKYRRKGPFDAVIMDLVMPDVDGFEATKRIRSHDRSNVPIVALSGDAMSINKAMALEYGFNAYLSKPLNIVELSHILESCLRERNAGLRASGSASVMNDDTDPLTGAGTVVAFADAIEDLAEQIAQGARVMFSIVICNVCGTDRINSALGHDTGDIYIKNCYAVMCKVFPHSSIYRVGGDEFAVLIQGYDYINRTNSMIELSESLFAAEKIADVHAGKTSFIYGTADYDPSYDYSVSHVYKRAVQSVKDNRRRVQKS